MSTRTFNVRRAGGPGLMAAVAGALLLAALLASTPALATNLDNLTVMGVQNNPDGSTVETAVEAYRWLVEQDKTYHVQTLPALCDDLLTTCTTNADCAGIGTEICNPGGTADPTVFDPNWDQYNDGIPGGETLAVGFHQSYMPVVGKGCVGFGDLTAPDFTCNEVAPVLSPNTYYYVSVVPRSGASIGGAGFKTNPDGSIPPTTVYVNRYPLPTAQISILIFHDNNSINNAPDLPAEDPLTDGDGDGNPDNPMAGFQILVEDAGGRYGASAGMQSQDAFGNPLGTEYDAGGNAVGWHPLITGPDGRLTIKNLAPGKYGIQAVPPAGSGYVQTATIEGTKVIDAWVKAGEPAFFAEFGPPGFHVFIGFVKKFNAIPAGGTTTITGQVVNNHLSRPPNYAFNAGTCFGHTTPWVGLNEMVGGLPGPGLFAAPTFGECAFEIPNVPAGDYQLVVWDSALDLVFAFAGITIGEGIGDTCEPGTACDLGSVPVFQWFHRSEHRVFDDLNADGIWNDTEGPAALEQAFNLRWRDGTINQSNVSDGVGAFAFDQVFPFFSWLVAEVDFLRFQATGLTVVVDDGGVVTTPVNGPAPLDDNDISFGGAITPQDQTNPADDFCTLNPTICEENGTYRVERGPVLTQGFQGFLGQTNAFLWGKRHYPDGQNGGISGIVFYAVTRAENNPQYAAAEVWEPGIPGVTVNLYKAPHCTTASTRQCITDADCPVGDTCGLPTYLDTTVTDSWDENLPTGCKWGNGALAGFQWTPDGTTFYPTDCFDGIRNWNQARPAVFDGGYAFGPEFDCTGGCPDWLEPKVGDPTIGYLKPDDYIVEIIPPPGYEIIKPEDKNVDFGDEYQPAPELLPPPCVGTLATVPPYLTLFPDQQIEAPFAGLQRPLCDKKLVTVSAGANAAADFWLFTEVPIAAHGLGFILDDTTAEFDPNSPQFGEKFAPPFVPVTIRDWTGRIIGKTLSDQYGRYNFIAASTATANLPQPSGMSPNMLTTCMNDPGDDPNNADPNWNQMYSTFCYNFQYMPGTTTYLDTPVLPIAAFTGPEQFPLDCEYPDGTPRIYSVSVEGNGVEGGGPYIATQTSGTLTTALPGQRIRIRSMGNRPVPNPNYCNPAAGLCPATADTVNKFVHRDYGFGRSGPGTTVTLEGLGGAPPFLTGCSWNVNEIACTINPARNIPAGSPALGRGRQLTVTRSNGLSSVAGVTVQLGLRPGATARVIGPTTPTNLPPLDHTIQDAIDAAGPNDLIMVRPSTYNELVVMWKPVQLQGFGEGSTAINAVKAPTEKLQIWRNLVDGLINGGNVDLLPGQEVAPGQPEPTTLWTEEGAGVLVLARATGPQAFDYQVGGATPRDNRGARIDGFTIRGADTGGGIVANGYTDFLRISNNRIANNQGFYGGGIRVGHPILTDPQNLAYTDGNNDRVTIHHNQVVFNGGLGGTGGGISMCTGSDSYAVTRNWVCGNFTGGEGAGIGHTGRSARDGNGPVPLIADNKVLFNESFYQAQTVSGGGIFVGGAAPLLLGGLSDGAGNVQITGNLIQGNSAGAGDGGGIRLAAVNGEDVVDNPGQPGSWYRVDVHNNIIVDNVAGLAGGGISLQDAVQVSIQNNTIANNDSLAVAGEAFEAGSPNQSTPQDGAGVVSRAHSGALADLALPPPIGVNAPVGTFSNPVAFVNNIVWQNRQFFFHVEAGVPGQTTGTWGLCPDIGGSITGLNCPGGNAVVYNDLGVIGAGGGACLSPSYAVLTAFTYPPNPCNYTGSGNKTTDPLFVNTYFNGARSNALSPDITTPIAVPPAFDEGGNYIKPAFGPLTLFYDTVTPDGAPGILNGNYHILFGSSARNATTTGISPDYDGNNRPQGTGITPFDIGADECVQVSGRCQATPLLKGLLGAIELDQPIDGNLTE